MDLRYPIGTFDMPSAALTPAQRAACIDQMQEAPEKLREALAGLSEQQLDTPYRPEGWTVRQVAHHLPDSHLNAYVRIKLALTEEDPAIQTYDEAQWARLGDSRQTPIDVSLSLLDALHRRWVVLLRALPDEDFARTARHPGWGRVSVDWLLAQYSWHGRHHVAHITSLKERQGWN